MLGTKRAPNYIQEEDKALCTVYVSASENPVKGTDQTGEIFWKDVKTKFNAEMKNQGWKSPVDR